MKPPKALLSKAEWGSSSPQSGLFRPTLRWSCDYGRSFSRYLIWGVAFVISYAGTYWLTIGRTFLDGLYFSIVAFATVGYRDILPVAPIEIIIGYLLVLAYTAIYLLPSD
ncbi:MAG: two pore domain potassium channel family protein [Methylobacter sp.]|nr:MAG: two pore domain potassium channel family protein [Methylobacter sp.]